MKRRSKIGEKAPEFCLPDAHNKRICLKDFRGKWIVLYFYPKDNTSGCTREAVDFTANIKDFKKMNAVVVGISPDSITSHMKFIDKHSLRVILLSDPEHEVLKEYGVWQKKSMYGREYYGVVRTTFVIDPKGIIRQKWDKVRVAGHADAVKDFVGVSCQRPVTK